VKNEYVGEKSVPVVLPQEKFHTDRNGIETEPTMVTDDAPVDSCMEKVLKSYRVHTTLRPVNKYRPLEGSHGLHMQVDAV
jgi:hypothetical protein